MKSTQKSGQKSGQKSVQGGAGVGQKSAAKSASRGRGTEKTQHSKKSKKNVAVEHFPKEQRTQSLSNRQAAKVLLGFDRLTFLILKELNYTFLNSFRRSVRCAAFRIYRWCFSGRSR